MNLTNYFWYFKSALTPRFCDEVIKYALQQQDTIARTGGFNKPKLSKEDIKNIQRKRRSDLVWFNDTWIYKEIKKTIKHFIEKILFMECNFKIYKSWLTLTKSNGNSSSHTHSNSWISGIYYPQHNEHFKIKFYNDITNVFETFSKKRTVYNTKSFTIVPEENEIILFFSNLRHEIVTNNSDKDRYSLAFNCLPQGSFGTGDSYNEFN